MLPTADLAPTGRAKCIQCGESIAKGSVRVVVERAIQTRGYEGTGAGYLHPGCAHAWAASSWPAGRADLIARVRASATCELPPPFDRDAPSEGARFAVSDAPDVAPPSAASERDDAPWPAGVFAVTSERAALVPPDGVLDVEGVIFSRRLLGGLWNPLSIPRWTPDAVAGALGIDVDEARSRLEALASKHRPETIVAPIAEGRLTRVVRTHHDGTYSASSAPQTYESQRFPDAYAIEAWVAVGSFRELDAALAQTRAKAPSWASAAPQLRWADGSSMSAGARAWYLASFVVKGRMHQASPKDAAKPASYAHDLLRHAFDVPSMRAFARWVITTRVKDGPRCFPLAPAALAEVAHALEAKKKLPTFVEEELLDEVVGRRLLLAAGRIGPARRDLACHDAWPLAPEGRDLAAWRKIATRFLDEAMECGLRIPSAAFVAHYLGRPWLAELVRARAWATGRAEAQPIALDALRPSAATAVFLVDTRAPDEGPAPVFADLAAPMHVREWKARCARASLRIHLPTPGSPHGPEAVAIDPLGTFLVRTTGYGGGGWGGNDKDIHIEVIEATVGGRSVWRCSKERNVGWETVDPTWRALIRERLRILAGTAARKFDPG